MSRSEDLVADLQRELKKLDLEFTDLYDKVRRQMGRMAKRYALDAKERDDPEDPEPVDEVEDGLDPISRKILLRRAGGGGHG